VRLRRSTPSSLRTAVALHTLLCHAGNASEAAVLRRNDGDNYAGIYC
jgi:hypothetical protein